MLLSFLPQGKTERKWLERDLKVAEAKNAQESWRKDARKTASTLHGQLCDQMRALHGDESAVAVLKYASCRVECLGLVLGLQEPLKRGDEQGTASAESAGKPSQMLRRGSTEDLNVAVAPEVDGDLPADPRVAREVVSGGADARTAPESARSEVEQESSCAVLPSSSKKLRKFLAQFRNAGSPPCRTYQNLLTLDEFSKFISKFDAVEKPGQLNGVREER
eukprot:6486298-Amphidinium_carterae.1